MSGAPIVIDKVSKRYGRVVALDGVSFEVRPNELFALLGPNGAGKTTLLHILCTILRPDGGAATINGCDVVKDPLGARRNLGIVFQEPSLDDRLTLAENLDFHGRVYGVPAAQRKQRIEAMLKLVELFDWRERLVRTLSSGMKRRLEIARALATHPTYILLDEPFAGIDPIAINDIRLLVRHLKDRGLGVLITDHNVREALEIIDRAYIIHDGQMLMEGTPSDIVGDKDVRRVYLGERFSL